MSFLYNMIFGKVKESEDPTGITNNASTNNKDASSTSEPVVEQKFTLRTLNKYNGHDDPRIFIAVNGNVYDCTPGRQFYGPSGPYNNFAGSDASRGLALNSFDSENIREWDQPIDDLSDLSPAQRKSLEDWEAHFAKKYTRIGELISASPAYSDDE
ncbi:Dap1p SCDLUD_002185 [Saccharomycodes ludwigii]|uniref:Dap1p n=1 Tax=Saccharomycodes ludwigii TaxID=36035 RepID=UPI001E849342|nr:hypothetical protein SCDLUD_002185 [Saccharomycodes ludwigii]KAH3902365.1 hypothetical protein SCDLUD_002185 [Saccharomycodes ludwigii]